MRKPAIHTFIFSILCCLSLLSCSNIPSLSEAKNGADFRENSTLSPHVCNKDLALQVLGSGGPIADDNRASSGYLLWLNGESRLLIDAGGGTALRFGEANGDFEQLQAVVLTHLHTDHSADLPALLKSSYFSERTAPLPVIGPGGNNRWPGTTAFVDGLFNSETGIYRYLDGFLDGSDGMYRLQPTEVNGAQPVTVLNSATLKLHAVRVHHGPVPAMGVLIETPTNEKPFIEKPFIEKPLIEENSKRIAISGDQSNRNPGFAKLIENVDLLIMAHAIPQFAGRVAKNLHATPEYIGQLANKANVKHLVLTHLMARSLNNLPESIEIIRQHYQGKLSVAEDLACYSP